MINCKKKNAVFNENHLNMLLILERKCDIIKNVILITFSIKNDYCVFLFLGYVYKGSGLLYKKAFLFNGIGSDPYKNFNILSSAMQQRALGYLEETFKTLNLNIEINKNSFYDKAVAECIFSSICDRVVFESFIEKGIIPDIGAGYSLGLVTCSSCFGAFPFYSSYCSMVNIKKIMMNLDKNNIKTGMGAIIGLDLDTVNKIICSAGEQNNASVGSVNSNYFIMITGMEQSVIKILKAADEEGALKTIKLGVDICFHNNMLASYCKEHGAYFTEDKFSQLNYPIISTIDQRIITDKSDLCSENQLSVIRQMRWDLTIDKLEKSGVTEFYDMSAYGSVKKFSRCTRKSKIYTYTDLL